MDTTFSIDASDFFRQLDTFESRMSAGDPIVLDGLLSVGDVYLDAMRSRFLKFSGGGGDWKPLAPSTAKAKGGPVPINRHSDELLTSLTPGAAGNVRQIEKPGTVVVGSSVTHAKYVQAERPVFVDPDPATQNRMNDAMVRAVDTFIADVFSKIQ